MHKHNFILDKEKDTLTCECGEKLENFQYPKYNGKAMDILRKKEFDFWRDNFETAIKMTETVKITDEDIKIIAWNCAFNVVCEDDKNYK